ncbi:MAG: outer membrane lipoprotein-sorting protein [Proteobacteria bacterium]|nr:outer membrane lipoprotein-sorting protein [Pseudomonadota bacterium]
MKIRLMRFFNRTGLPLLSLLVILLAIGGTLQAADLPKLIDKSNCAQYKDLLIPALYRAVERGAWVVTPGIINFKYKHLDSFLAASAKNAGRFDVDAAGELIEKSTGKIAETNFYGMPFPNIDRKDPRVADKIIWNFNYQKYRFMGTRMVAQAFWINQTGVERYIKGFDIRLYMMGRPLGTEIKNPDKVLTYELVNSLEPMSVKGTNTLSYGYIDERDNTNFAYVPAIRRIRKTTSTSRSDPFMGSDAWLDMNYMWAGKNSSMKWKLVGEKTILVSFTSPNMLPMQEFTDGSVQPVYPYTGERIKMGCEVPGWKGDAWAPGPGTLTYVPRKVWVIEQMPKDPYYNWGLHINYVDQETYTIWYKEVYDKSGEFRIWVSLLTHYSESPSGKNNTGDYDGTLFVDEKFRHSTWSSVRVSNSEARLYLPASKLDPDYFTVNNFLLLSK